METYSFYETRIPGKQEPDTIRSGPLVGWDSLGREWYRKNYHEGKLDGVSEDFFPDGKVRARYFYRNDTLDSAYGWDEKGRLRSRSIHSMGKSVLYFIDEFGNSSEGMTPEQID